MTDRAVPNPSRLCLCGCGTPTTVCKRDGGGYRRGESYRYVIGHQHRKSGVQYIVDLETGCWVWQLAAGAVQTGPGYGIMRVKGGYVRAHRHFYEQRFGAIPAGLELDHLCGNTLCVNPDHLEAVTHTENVRRGKATRLTYQQVERRDPCAPKGCRFATSRPASAIRRGR